MKGRPRKPTVIHELQGTFKRNPERARPSEPVPTAGIGPAPAHLDEAQALAWDEIVRVSPPGVLFNSDRLVLEIAAVLFTQFRNNPDFPITGIGRLQSLLSSLGMTPADRSKISVPKGKSKNPYEDM
jgi:hypothetical protein